MQKLSHPYWSEAFVSYKQLSSMVDFLNSNARFDGLFNGETVSSGPSQLSLGSGDSLSSSVHCAPDEND